MKQILVLCATFRDRRELIRVGAPEGAEFLFHDYASIELEDLLAEEPPDDVSIADPITELARITDLCAGKDIVAVTSTDDYPGAALAAIVADALGLPGPDPAATLLCQHKFESRRLQQRYAPAATPDFALLDVDAPLPALAYPTFIKPVKSFFSIGARLVGSERALRDEQARWAPLDAFFAPFDGLLQRVCGLRIGGGRLIAETPLTGDQFTLEGYVRDDAFHLIGIVDSVMYPGTSAFERFEYPSSLPTPVQDRMAEIAGAVMLGIGYADAIFNVEFMYDSETGDLSIIEINPRLASQFADLYEKVDGRNGYEILLDLALGRPPAAPRRQGPHRMAASCVLRCFENRKVLAMPREDEIAALERRYPGVRVEPLATPGKRLSQEMQDGSSYRYGIVSLGGRDRDDILDRLADSLRRLTFAFVPVTAPADQLEDTEA